MPNFYKQREKRGTSSRGFLMMYAVLFITVVLTISMGILDIALRQFAISSVNRESPRALYAADAGLDCAFYGDILNGYFSTSTPDTTHVGLCGANDVTVIPIDRNSNPIVWQEFMVKFGSGSELLCAKVSVKKDVNANGDITLTTIDSRGYNTDCPPAASLRFPLVERGLTATY